MRNKRNKAINKFIITLPIVLNHLFLSYIFLYLIKCDNTDDFESYLAFKKHSSIT